MSFLLFLAQMQDGRNDVFQSSYYLPPKCVRMKVEALETQQFEQGTNQMLTKVKTDQYDEGKKFQHKKKSQHTIQFQE